MKQIITYLLAFSVGLNCFGQNANNWTILDDLNQNPNFPFKTEKEIRGICFLTLSDNFDYYHSPIIVKNTNNELVAKIEFVDTIGIQTTYEDQTYNSFDTLNPFKPWLWIDNPDYFRLAFECTDTTREYYKVWLNEEDFTFINKTDKSFKKQSLNDFILRWTASPMGLDFNRKSNPLKRNPNEQSEIISQELPNKYKIWNAESIIIKGNWMKVKTITDEVGWIKWREGKKLFIRMYFAC